MASKTAKDMIISFLKTLPDDITLDEIIYCLQENEKSIEDLTETNITNQISDELPIKKISIDDIIQPIKNKTPKKYKKVVSIDENLSYFIESLNSDNSENITDAIYEHDLM